MKKTAIVLLALVVSLFQGCNSEELLSPEEQLSQDIEIIQAFVNENGIDAAQHSSGLFYVIHEQGTGINPNLNNQVRVNYKGNILGNSQVFDSGESVTFPLRNLIAGWQIGFPLLQSGGKATLYIPSGLGYGSNGAGNTIPANANLVFEVDLLEVL